MGSKNQDTEILGRRLRRNSESQVLIVIGTKLMGFCSLDRDPGKSSCILALSVLGFSSEYLVCGEGVSQFWERPSGPVRGTRVYAVLVNQLSRNKNVFDV